MGALNGTFVTVILMNAMNQHVHWAYAVGEYCFYPKCLSLYSAYVKIPAYLNDLSTRLSSLPSIIPNEPAQEWDTLNTPYTCVWIDDTPFQRYSNYIAKYKLYLFPG